MSSLPMAVSTVTQNKENYNIQMSPKKPQPLPDNKQPMEKTDKLTIEEKVIKMLKTVYDLVRDDFSNAGITLFKQGDELISGNYESRMSEDSKRLYAGTDLEHSKRQRKANAKCILEGLRELGMSPLIEVPDDSVPLFVPVYLEDRDIVRMRMFQCEVYCPIHWPLEGLLFKKGKEMADHELSLIVDQRYSERDMNLILKLLD